MRSQSAGGVRHTRWRSWLRHCATSRKGAGSIPDGFIGTSNDVILRPRYDPGVDSASNINDYQECPVGSKGGP